MQPDTLQHIRQEKEQLRRQIDDSSQKLQQYVHSLFSPALQQQDKVHTLATYFDNGLAIWEGVRMGMSFISAFKRIFGRRK